MGKNKNGDFIPPKGRPSGTGREASGLKDAFAVTNLKEDAQLAEKYMEAPDEPAANVYIRHPNRNVDKGREHNPDENE